MTQPLNKEPHFIVVHGVQTGTDDDIQSDKQIRSLLKDRLKAINREEQYTVLGVKYEDLNDEAQSASQMLLSVLNKGSPFSKLLSSRILDLVGDVYIASKGTKTANKIRDKIKKRILKSYQDGHPVYLVAHSLGTVYCLDVICELMKEADYYNTGTQDSWPVQSYITLGSPLGLTNIFKARQLSPVRQPLFSPFSWHNFHHPLDPVVSGNIFGAPIKFDGVQGPIEKCYKSQLKGAHWSIDAYRVAQSKQWLLAHICYWKDPMIGDALIDIVWG